MKFKISDLSKVLGIASMTLRRYEKQGYITPERDASNYRFYKETDISKMIEIRLLRKCGFSHQNIEQFFGNSTNEIRAIAKNRLDEIDAEIARLKYLRHWLKDNIQLVDNVTNIGNGFVTMECPPLRYVLYSSDTELYKEQERIKTINDFLYTIEEVQAVTLFKYPDTPISSTPYHGLAIKEMDIERLGISDIIERNKYIEIYPQQLCLYGIVSFSSDYLKEIKEKKVSIADEFHSRMSEYLKENSFIISGDTVVFTITLLGKSADYLVCVPIKKI